MSAPGVEPIRRAGAFAARALRSGGVIEALGRPRSMPVDATPLALFRIGFGVCLILETVDLLRFRPLFFDEVPYIAASRLPVVPGLVLWMIAAIGIVLGYRTRLCAIVNYACVVVFLGFLAVPYGFEYHLDGLYLLVSFAMLFMPVSRACSLDRIRAGSKAPPPVASPVAWVFLALVVSSIYFDSALWKLSSRMWIGGLGYWTPATQPWDAFVSIPWTLESVLVTKTFGYVTLAFEFAFPVLVFVRRLRVPLLAIAFALHVGIGTVIPLPRFGMLMIVLLVGLLPPDWFSRPRGSSVGGAVAMGASAACEPWGRSWSRRTRATVIGVLLGSWGIAFAAGLSEPVTTLARYGVGGVDREFEPPPPVSSDEPWARVYRRVMGWCYHGFGTRTHPIFLDRQFCDYTEQTRLVYRRDGVHEGGMRIDVAVRDRLFLPWTYRIVRPRLPRARVEVQLRRYVAYWAQRRGLDLASGSIWVQQRPIDVPTDAWRKGQRARNLEASWRDVGRIRGPIDALAFSWRDPSWD